MVYAFEDFELDLDAYELRKGGVVQHLEPQVFDVLACLIENCGRLVTKEELMDRVWGDRFISEAALNSRVMAARRVLGDNGQDQRLIRTQRGRGFRFVADLKQIGGVAPAIEAMKVPGEPRQTARPEVLEGPEALEGGRGNDYATAPRVPVTPSEQEVRFCTAPDGVRIAYASVGSGPVLLKAPNWLTHLEFEWKSPVWRHWWAELARYFRIIRFDQRGSGLSDREVADMSFEAWLLDLETVVEAAGVERFSLLGVSQGGPVAIEYAIRHSERVNKLVLYGAYTQGRLARGGASREEFTALQTLIRAGWGRDNPAYRQMFTTQFMPEATHIEMAWFNELQRVSTSGENAARLQEVGSNIDVLRRLREVTVPTLVLHTAGDERVPFDQGRLLASMIPNARLVALESRNHLIRQDEPAWGQLVAEVRAFLE